LSRVKPVLADLVDLDIDKGSLVPVADDVVMGEGEVGRVDAVFEEGVEAVLFLICLGWRGGGGGREGEEIRISIEPLLLYEQFCRHEMPSGLFCSWFLHLTLLPALL